jgi:hypothetical protein
MEIKPAPDEQMWFSIFRLGNWPDFHPGVQFPKDEESLNQYFRQMTPNTGPYDDQVISDALVALFEKTGGGILVTHSQGGGPGWYTAIKSPKVNAIVSYEPGLFIFPEGEVPAPIPSSSPFGALNAAGVPMDDFLRLTNIPIVLYYGDNIPEEPSDDPGKDNWRTRLQMANLWVEAINKHGGDATLVHLPQIGVEGNTHFPFSDLNNVEIADLLSKWLKDKELDRLYAQFEKFETYTPEPGQDGKDVIWLPTNQELVDTMLDMAKVTSSDYVIDLGSGDGRLVITAAKRGATALGIEYNPDLVEFSRRAAVKEGVSAKAAFEKADIFESDFSHATVITMFLLPSLNMQLRPIILDMQPGTRIVSNSFDMEDWEPDMTVELKQIISDYNIAYLWIVPAKVNGTWKFDDGQIDFIQDFQKLTGTLTTVNESVELTGKLDGDKISFTAGETEYTGTVSGKAISGTRTGGGSWKATR